MDSGDQWLTDTDGDDSSSESSDSGSGSSDDYNDSGESDTWGSYSGTSNSASSSAPDVQKQETLVGYVCRFCKRIVEDIGRMIARLSEIIRGTEEEAPKNHGTDDGSETEDEPHPKPEPDNSDNESSCYESEDTDTDDENALLTDRQSRKGQTGFAARKNSEAALKKYRSQQTRRRYGRQEIVVTPSY